MINATLFDTFGAFIVIEVSYVLHASLYIPSS